MCKSMVDTEKGTAPFGRTLVFKDRYHNKTEPTG